MSAKSVICLAMSRSHAEDIVGRLKSAGFSENDISVLFPDTSSPRGFAYEKGTKAPVVAAAGAGAGGAVGGALGWLVGLGAVAIPGAGPFVAAGPMMATLSGAAVGAAVGGITGALVGLGIPEYEARRYEGRIRAGKILISVHTDDSEEVDRAKGIFAAAGAEDIASAPEQSVPAGSAAEVTGGR
jgi:hypothetical protein